MAFGLTLAGPQIRLRQQAVSEWLIGTYWAPWRTWTRDGKAAAQLSDIEEVSAYHGDNYEVLVRRFFRTDRAVMFELAAKLDLVATSSRGTGGARSPTGAAPAW